MPVLGTLVRCETLYPIEMMSALGGIRVLVVEDEFLIATLIEDILLGVGCVVAGPIPRLSEALDAVDRGHFDAAVLDVNLGGDRVYPVADALSRRNVPFVFVTGYSTDVLPCEYDERPRLCKPFKIADLLKTVSNLVASTPMHCEQKDSPES